MFKLFFFRLSVLIQKFEICLVKIRAISDCDLKCMKLYTCLESLWQVEQLTLFSKKSEHVSIFDPRGTLKVNGSHLGNAATCGISEKCCLCFAFTFYQIFNKYRTIMPLSCFLCFVAEVQRLLGLCSLNSTVALESWGSRALRAFNFETGCSEFQPGPSQR